MKTKKQKLAEVMYKTNYGRTVTIEVRSGVAEIISKPDDVDVEIIDCDN
jgi:hypothetical protein